MRNVQLFSGSFAEGAPTSESESMLEKEVLMVYPGKFMSMDGEVEVTDEMVSKLWQNHNSVLSKVKRMATGDLPLKDCPPLQLDHLASATATVGRVIGELTLKDTEIDGQTVKALFGKVRVLGKENVEKVKDGRWIHLSIGADLENGRLNELTITPFPAAAHAHMLSRLARWHKDSGEAFSYARNCEVAEGSLNGKEIYMVIGQWGGEMGEKPGQYHWEISYVEGFQYLKDGDSPTAMDARAAAERAAKALGATLLSSTRDPQAILESASKIFHKLFKGATMDPKKKEALKKHLMEEKKMSEKDADEKLAALSKEDEDKLSTEVAEKDKKLAAEKEEKEKLAKEESDKAKLAQKTSFVKLAKDFRSSISDTQLSTKRSQLSIRLSSLRANAKITPAEIKKIDLDKLSRESEATVEAVMKSYESREPVVMVGLFGSAKAEEVARLAEEAKRQSALQESLSNMEFTKKGLGDKLSEGVIEDGKKMTANDVPHPELEGAMEEYDKFMRMGERDKARDSLKAYFAKMFSSLASESSPANDAQKAEMSSLAKNVEKLQNQFEEVLKLVGPALGIEDADLK